MIRINLLPVRQNRKIEAARRDLLLSILGAVATVGALFAGWAAAAVQLQSQLEDNSSMQAEVDRLQIDVAKVDEIEKLQAELRQKLAVIGELRARKSGPVHMLDDLANATPDRLRMTALEQNGAQLQITGVSVNNETISQFLRALDASPYFGDVFLQDIESTPPDPDFGGELKAFKLSAKVTLPTAEELAGTAGGAPAAPAPDGAAPAPAEAAAPAAPPADAPATGGAAAPTPDAPAPAGGAQ